MNPMLSSLQELYKKSEDASLKDFFTFLKFASVSSEKNHKEDVLKCANWLKDYVAKMGFETQLWQTSGHPILFASLMKAGKEKPTLLIYNHYDVQPVDPIELWSSLPFEPTIKEGQIFARGAQDNKGQCFFVLQALKLLLQKYDGSLPINIKLCIEGEEETGSEGLSQILKSKQKELQADYLAIVDLGIKDPKQPAVTLGVRGIVTLDVKVQGSNTDLHSGSHGGIVYNPLHALVEILSKLRDDQGKITIAGFYDDVLAFPDKEKSKLNLAFDKEEYQQTFQAYPTGGEKGYTPLERAWIRPTLEINGINGGYTGTGFKTVIPASAIAKISCRLVPNQDPLKIASLVKDAILSKTPEGIKTEVKIHEGIGKSVRSDPSSKVIQAFSKAYSEIFQKETDYIFEGGSIPIVEKLSEASGSSVALLGLGLSSDKIHAPNEHFGIDRLEKGALIIARAIEFLAAD